MILRIALAAAVLVLVALAVWHPASPGVKSVTSASPSDPGVPPSRRARRSTSASMLVYVAGAVRRPGLYRLPDQARAVDAVAAAGGLTEGAAPGGVNLAARLSDGDEVFAPEPGQRAVRRSGGSVRHARPRSGSRRRPPPAGGVDVNADAADRLASVPGIGPAIAARIVEMRVSSGPYATLDELLDVAGMTQTRLERARPYLRPP